MRFLLRGLTGLALFAAALALAALGAWRLTAALDAPEAERARAPEERSVIVSTATLERETTRPDVEAYGEIESRRRLTLRAAGPGRVVDVADTFRDGARVAAGDLLLRVDPADYESRVAEAEAALAEAEADVAEARAGRAAAQIELEAARKREDLRAAQLKRQRDLAERGVSAGSAVDEAELALAAAEQEVATRRQALTTARLRIDRAELAARRAEIALDETRRELDETRVAAPFAGVLTEVSADLGDLLAVNEAVGALLDPDALEARFTVRNEVYASLLGPSGALRPLDVSVTLPLGRERFEASGTLDRAGAEAGPAGRVLYARLEPQAGGLLRPGDFVTVTFREPPLEGVGVIPETAATEDGRILILNDAGRLEERRVTILRRARDRLIVADAPFGATYVTERGPQIGPGLKATPRGAQTAPETVALDPRRREALLAYVRTAPEMSEERRAELLSILAEPEAPRGVVERLEARMVEG